MNSLPEFLFKGLHPVHLEKLEIECSMELLKNICLMDDGLEWPRNILINKKKKNAARHGHARRATPACTQPHAVQHGTERAALTSSPTPLSQPSPCSLFLSIFSLVSIEHHRRRHHRCLHSPFFLPPLRAPLLALAVSAASLHSVLHRRPPPPSSPNTVSITHLPCVSLSPLSQPSITVTLRHSSLLFLRLSPLRQPPRRRPSPPFPCSFSASSFQSPNAIDRPRLSSVPPNRPPLLPSATTATSSLCPSISDHRPDHRLSALLVGSFLADDRGQPPRALSSSVGSIVPPCQSLFSLRPPSASRPPSLFSSLPLSLRAAAGHRHRRHFPLPAPR